MNIVTNCNSRLSSAYQSEAVDADTIADRNMLSAKESHRPIDSHVWAQNSNAKVLEFRQAVAV